jgi:hypothetical protein
MAVATSGLIALTEEQRRDFDEKGYVIIEDFFTPADFDRLLSAIDEVGEKIRAAKGLGPGDPWALRNALDKHEAFLDLIDHPRILPLVVDTIGWNVQIRTTHLDVRPPYPADMEAGELGRGKGADHKAGYRNVVWHPDLAGPYLFEGPSRDGYLPFMEIKIGLFLSDLTQHNSGALCVVPGSHRRKPQELRDADYSVDPSEVVELNFRPNTALVWQTPVWHTVSPNLSDKVRKVFYVGYHYRWMRPTDYYTQDPALIARSSPIRRQLLGALATDSNPLGDDPYWHPGSQHWIPKNWDDVPLKAWAEERVAQKQQKLLGLHL